MGAAGIEIDPFLAASRQALSVHDSLKRLGRGPDAGRMADDAALNAAIALCLDPMLAEAGRLLSIALYHQGLLQAAARAARHPDPRPGLPGQSIVIAVIDRPMDGQYGIDHLLADLAGFVGEVIVVFNDPDIGMAMRGHPRIDKWAIISANAGVARAWNIGLNLAQGQIAFVLNADIRVQLDALRKLGQALAVLPHTAIAGVGGEIIDPDSLTPVQALPPGAFSRIVAVDKITGYLFALHLGRLWDAGISFDPRLSPYFFEELDLAGKCHRAGLGVIAVPVDPVLWSHEGGISLRDQPVRLFGTLVDRARVLAENAARVQQRYMPKAD